MQHATANRPPHDAPRAGRACRVLDVRTAETTARLGRGADRIHAADTRAAIWNGFPFMFYDSGAFIEMAMIGGFIAERSAFYGVFLSLFRPASAYGRRWSHRWR